MSPNEFQSYIKSGNMFEYKSGSIMKSETPEEFIQLYMKKKKIRKFESLFTNRMIQDGILKVTKENKKSKNNQRITK